jgi:N-acetylmuramoyl-L-alanine amidase
MAPMALFALVGRALAVVAIALSLGMPGAGEAQTHDAAALHAPFSALARANPDTSRLTASGPGVAVVIGLSQPVPYRVAHLADPPRLVVEFSEALFDAATLERLRLPGRVSGAQASQPRPGWSRLTLELAGTYLLSEAEMRADPATGAAGLRLRLDPASEGAFAARVAETAHILPQDAPEVTVPAPAPAPRRAPDAPLIVMLDPGHGGVDPGAEREGHREADLVLTFARELAETLTRSGRFTPVLTRDADQFVSLEARIRLAHRAGADVFLSLHADALEGGGASGAAIYALSEEASDAASAALAERHNRDDLVTGVDLTDHDDQIADVLMDLARRQTEPRTEALAQALAAGLRAEGVRLHSRPLQQAAFSVLKSPDIPSVLIELGFLSSRRDIENLLDPDWRGKAARGITVALETWTWHEAGRLLQ